MTVTNIIETIKVPASFLVDGINALPDEVKRRLLTLTQTTDEAEKSKELEELIALIPEEMQKNLNFVGAKLPTDIVELSMKLGDFLYHLWTFNTKPAQAPLAIKRHEKRTMELADTLDKLEIEVPEDVKKVVSSILDDEPKWKATQFGAFVVVDGQTKYLGLTAVGAACFTKILNAAVELVV